MKILVCVKCVQDLEQILDEDWKDVTVDSLSTLNYGKWIWNTFDEIALEIALRFVQSAEKNGEAAEIIVLTIGEKEQCEKLLREAYAVGVHKCICVKPISEKECSPKEVAKIIKKIAKDSPTQWILCGSQSGNYEEGQTPYLVAEYMGMPCVDQIQRMEKGENCYKIWRDTETYTEEIHVDVPVVGVFSNVEGVALRMPTLKKRLESSKKEIIYLSFGELTEKNVAQIEHTKILRELTHESGGRTCTYISGDDNAIAEKLKELLLG